MAPSSMLKVAVLFVAVACARAMYLHPRLRNPFARQIGWREDPCGRTLAAYRMAGIPGIPLSPEKPSNSTAPPPAINPMLMMDVDLPDLPDMHDVQLLLYSRRSGQIGGARGVRVGGNPGTGGRVGAGGAIGSARLGSAQPTGLSGHAYFPAFERCRCDSAFECLPLSGSRVDTKYDHQCHPALGLVCCCSPP